MRFFFIFVSLWAFLAMGCLEAPAAPAMSSPPPSVQVALLTMVGDTNYSLQAVPGASVSFLAVVTPSPLASKLNYQWIYNDSLFSTGQTSQKFPIPERSNGFWKMELRVTDSEENRFTVPFQLQVGHFPSFPVSALFEPASGDTLSLDINQTLTFQWFSQDIDPHETLYHHWDLRLAHTDTLLATVFTAQATAVPFSRLFPGSYEYRVRVYDSMNLADTSDWLLFHVRSPQAL